MSILSKYRTYETRGQRGVADQVPGHVTVREYS